MELKSLGYVGIRACDLNEWASFGTHFLGMQLVDRSRSTLTFRMDDRRQREAPSFDEVKERVRASMIHRKAQQVASELRGKAQIEYIDPEIKKSVESDRRPAAPKQ